MRNGLATDKPECLRRPPEPRRREAGNRTPNPTLSLRSGSGSGRASCSRTRGGSAAGGAAPSRGQSAQRSRGRGSDLLRVRVTLPSDVPWLGALVAQRSRRWSDLNSWGRWDPASVWGQPGCGGERTQVAVPGALPHGSLSTRKAKLRLCPSFICSVIPPMRQSWC
jgi:hypothetical protein